ncbi:MAG: MBL fold metallo-hydrolase [Chloroflexota bacterium]|nr:MBL fold metallo-hydrolase [Chloroflexota bacterium]
MMPPAREILAEVTATEVREGAVALWWLGQASVLLKGADTTLYIDPFLSEMEGRLIPPPFGPEEAPPADLILITHDHIDHLDERTLPEMTRSSPNAWFVAPQPLVGRLASIGIPEGRTIGVRVDEPVTLNGMTVTAVPAMHAFRSPPSVYDFETDDEGQHAFVGYLLDFKGVRVYHAGDTVIYDGMADRLRDMKPDVALFPINGRGYYREQQAIFGNMDEREAADLAADLGVRLLIPIHYDMFASNLGNPGSLVQYVRAFHPELAVLLPAGGRRFVYESGH